MACYRFLKYSLSFIQNELGVNPSSSSGLFHKPTKDFYTNNLNLNTDSTFLSFSFYNTMNKCIFLESIMY